MQRKSFALALLPAAGLIAGCGSNNTPTAPVTPAPNLSPALYTQTNSLTGNAVIAYSRGTGGALTATGTYPTSGNGTGLPTQGLPFPIGGATGSVILSPDRTRLYAVDAGTNDIAAFNISATDGSLTRIGTYPTGGTSPASLTINAAGTYLYVLNTGTLPSGNNVAGGIAGFTINADGSLTALANSTQPLSAAAYVDPAEVAFSPSGSYLAVTEKQPGGVGQIDVYPVTNGVAGPPVSTASTGSIPFGFNFTAAGVFVVSNAESVSVPNTATLSSYTATPAGALTVVSGRVPDSQSAACWVALTSDGTTAYTTNTLSGSISAYTVSATGALTLLTPGGVTAPQANTTGPIDDIVSPDNTVLYVLDSNAGATPGTIAVFSIAADRTLTAAPTTITGLLPGSVGLAVR